MKDTNIFFVIIKLIASYENAEKVVKDPSNPTIKKNLIKSSEIFFINVDVIRYPIKKDPIIFTESVP